MKNYFLKLYLFECVYKIEHWKAGDSERSFMHRPCELSSRYLLVACWRWGGTAHGGTLVLHTRPWRCCADSCCSVSETWVRFAVAAVSWASEAWLSFWGPGVWLRWPFVCLHLQLLKIQSGPSSPGLLSCWRHPGWSHFASTLASQLVLSMLRCLSCQRESNE